MLAKYKHSKCFGKDQKHRIKKKFEKKKFKVIESMIRKVVIQRVDPILSERYLTSKTKLTGRSGFKFRIKYDFGTN